VKLSSRETPNELRPRVVLAGLAVLLSFAAIALRLWVLQVGQGDNWLSLSESNRIRISRLPATRGVIYDRNGEPLVENRTSFDVAVVPEDAKDLDAIIKQVSTFLGAEPPTMASVLAMARQRPPYEATIIYRDVDYDRVVVPLETHRLDWPGVSLENGARRAYRYRTDATRPDLVETPGTTPSLASHLLGYVGEVTTGELEAKPEYRMGDLTGKFGAEKAFESLLRGIPGGQQIEVDAMGRKLRVLSRVPDTQGNNMVLTIDRRLQEFVEQQLQGRDGAIVVLQPTTGAILAMTSQPAFDPNVFARGVTPREWRGLLTDKAKPLNNRAIQGQYPPGSTFKIVTAAAGLEEGVITPFTRIGCGGAYHFANRDYRCWKKGGHGSVDLHRAIVESCDVYFYQVGQRLGVDTINEYAHRFGLGDVTGIALDHEKPGLIPSSKWKLDRFKEPWFAGETLSVAIGQGYVLATPLQMANLIATVANGGTRYKPHYVARIEPPGGNGPVQEITPEVLGNAGLRKTTLLQLREALKDVVNAPTGTGKKAKLPTIEVAGKTGTSQVFKMSAGARTKTAGMQKDLRDHAWFVAFAPVEQPEIAIAVLIEHAGTGGGATAAPVAHDIADYYFALTRGRTYQLAGAEGAVNPRVASNDPANPSAVEISDGVRSLLRDAAPDRG
jgi:penicillin-binding protein 2